MIQGKDIFICVVVIQWWDEMIQVKVNPETADKPIHRKKSFFLAPIKPYVNLSSYIGTLANVALKCNFDIFL